MRKITVFALLLLSLAAGAAESPTPYHTSYEASYLGMKANAERSLEQLEDTRYRLSSSVSLKLLGATLTSIDEFSDFRWQNDRVVPVDYVFDQSGLGSRTRSVDFDWKTGSAEAVVEDNVTTLSLEKQKGRLFDALSMYMELRRQLEAGVREVSVQAIDEGRIEQERYRVLQEETVDTPLGRFETVKLEKVREPDSERLTHLWLSPSMEYMLIKLFQRDPDGRELELTLSGGTYGGQPLRPDAG